MIRFEKASLDYGTGRVALGETDLDVGPGLTLLLGPNGAGKSSFLKLAAGVECPQTGRVLVNGLDLWVDETKARRLLAYVPEHPDLTPYASLHEVIQLVCRLRGETMDCGVAALTRAGLAAAADRTIRELSMGQRRRALLATAFVGHPAIVLLDEPLEGMDRAMQESIVTWVEQLAAAGVTVVVSTHEIELFAVHASRVVAVADGQATLIDELPAAMAERVVRLEALARYGR